MGWGTGNLGGGSGGLNFKVVGGTSEPTSAKENTIWVNTDQKITGYILSATEPEEPEEGMVLITIGTESAVAFSVTKKNPVMVYPISAKQFVSGAWADKVAKSYQGGKWVDWVTYLFNNGEVLDISTWSEQNIAITVSDKITIIGSGSWMHFFGIWTTEKINLTGKKKICVEGKFTAANYGYIGITSAPFSGTTSHSSVVAKKALDTTNTKWELDISGYPGEYYPCIFVNDSQQTVWTAGTITKWWIE